MLRVDAQACLEHVVTLPVVINNFTSRALRRSAPVQDLMTVLR